MPEYLTWYEFKKDLQRVSGRSLLNTDWLDVKPTAPLPWDKSLLHSALLKLQRLSRQRQNRQLVAKN